MYQRSVLLHLPKSQTIDIEFSNIIHEVQDGFRRPKKQILKGVSGMFKSGELTAIMGPSGAGKSTLLNMLTGFQKDNINGTIVYTNSQGKCAWNEYKKDSCYIQQNDQLHPLFTVFEVMTMSADLKLGNSLNRKAKEILIDDILDSLDLSKTKEIRCNRLSGGQKKRLSIALELVDNPPVMFLDEPTTGLDSSSSMQCIAMLQTLARGGRTIVCTIHQPSAAIYEIFDHVYLLAEGRCMYEGAAKNTVAYFNSVGLQCPKYHNPADYMIEVVSKEYGNYDEQLINAIRDSERSWRARSVTKSQIFGNDLVRQHSEEGKATVLINTPSEVTRFWILLNRCFVQLYRDWTVTHLKLLVHMLTGVLLGLLFDDSGINGKKTISNAGFFTISIVYLCYTSMLPAVLRFPAEMAVLKKERFNNWYQLRTYYVALIIANIPSQLLSTFVYSSIAYFLSNQPQVWNRYFMFLAIAALTTLIADSYGLVLGTLVNPINGTFLAAITMCIYLILAGFLVLYKDMPRVLYYMSYFSYFKYALHGMVHAIYGFNREKLPCPKDVLYCHYRVPKTFLEDFSMTDGKYWVDVVVLFVSCIVFRIIAYCTLKRKLSSA